MDRPDKPGDDEKVVARERCVSAQHFEAGPFVAGLADVGDALAEIRVGQSRS
jgi:hypothetical protein